MNFTHQVVRQHTVSEPEHTGIHVLTYQHVLSCTVRGNETINITINYSGMQLPVIPFLNPPPFPLCELTNWLHISPYI